MQGRSAQPGRVEGELYDSPVARYDSSQDNVARLVVYFGPYILWGSIGALAGLLFLMSA